jgi:hypothetical protein
LKGKQDIILDLCGGTGAWSKPWKEAGYTVYVITLPYYDVTDWHMSGDGKDLVCFGQNGSITLRIEIARIFGILAAPPCTQFSFARTRGKEPRNLREGWEIVKACHEIIVEVRLHITEVKDGALRFWALENPKGYLCHLLGDPKLEFDPCDYGDPWQKRTHIFGHFKLPKKTPVEIPQEEKAKFATNSAMLHKLPARPAPLIDDDGYEPIPGVESRTERRSITPPGFAQLFFEANR